MPDEVKRIGYEAFGRNNSLSVVDLSLCNNLTYIGSRAFKIDVGFSRISFKVPVLNTRVVKLLRESGHLQ